VPSLIESVRRFQLGESGDGLQLQRKAAQAGDPEYLRAAELFVAEEHPHTRFQQHRLRAGFADVGTPLRRGGRGRGPSLSDY
jgi:hypothetical protein